ncbi:hypothetical protein EVAR_30656_1 [Eumeta japonica]|uniref:Uncharacterized protein n=1 Tax=Eumeta variegata TaxID=151549 RepID=A0A4C1VQ14_EUMVA|nr:hypothetical protein EVAR_30656_1 [Eumeta japonica]
MLRAVVIEAGVRSLTAHSKTKKGREPRRSTRYDRESVFRAHVAFMREKCKEHGHTSIKMYGTHMCRRMLHLQIAVRSMQRSSTSTLWTTREWSRVWKEFCYPDRGLDNNMDPTRVSVQVTSCTEGIS